MLLVVGTVSGLLVTGAGGRLAMRLLAVTSPEATGRLTEAQATVGEITFEGTIGYLVFGALPFAFASTALYLLVAPWLPRGRLAGPTFGLAVFIVVAPFIDPLRADNVDFDIVGPGWLAVLVFAALAVLQGAFLSAFAGRLSRSLPLMTRTNWPDTVLPLLLAVVLFPLGAVLAVGALVTFALPRPPAVVPRRPCVTRRGDRGPHPPRTRRARGAAGIRGRGGVDLGIAEPAASVTSTTSSPAAALGASGARLGHVACGHEPRR